MYKIIGADQKEYGPISTDQIRQWISEGRVNGKTPVCAEGSEEWKPLEMYPEFGLAPGAVLAATAAAEGAPVAPEEILARDYSLDIIGCVSRAWGVFKNNFGTLVVTFLLLVALVFGASLVIQVILAIGGVNRLPYKTTQYLTPVYFIFLALVMGPATGGLYQVYLAVIRGRPASAGDLFSGFKQFQDLYLGKLIPGVIGSACMLPYNIVNASKLGPIMDSLRQNPGSTNPQEIFPHMISAFSSSLPVFLICMIPAMYFSINWMFVLPLISDKKMGVWGGLKTSWIMVHRHWFQVFGLAVVVGLINIGGVCACCIGLFVTVPLTLTALMCAYEDIFSRKTA
jgi:GYF domain 2/Membrane domain of glycerophosphoryl diester phosphodiesterase